MFREESNEFEGNIRVTIRNDAGDSATAIENSENLSNEILHDEEVVDYDDDYNVDDDNASDDNNNEAVDVDDAVNESPNKILKLQTPKFIKPKPLACWQPVAVENCNRSAKLGIETICPDICFFFLHDECVEGEHCYNSHELPEPSIVRQRLIGCGAENASKLFRIIVARCPKLLHPYFCVFVNIFAELRLTAHLIATICICERERNREKRFELFQQLIQAFIKCGETYKSAMETILYNAETMNQDTVDTLLNMNLVTGIGVSDFLGVFQSLNKHRFIFNEPIIDRLMFLCTHSEDALPTDKLTDFARLIFDILKSNKHVLRTLNKIYYHNYIQLYERYRNRNGISQKN